MARNAPESKPVDWGSKGRKPDTSAARDTSAREMSARTKPAREVTLPRASTTPDSDPLSSPSDYAKRPAGADKTKTAKGAPGSPSSVPDSLPDASAVMADAKKNGLEDDKANAILQTAKKHGPPPGSGSVLAAGDPKYYPVPVPTLPVPLGPPPGANIPMPPMPRIPQAPQPNQGMFSRTDCGSPPPGYKNAFTKPGPARPVPGETIPAEGTVNAFADVIEGQGTLPLPVSPLVSHLPPGMARLGCPPQGCPPQPCPMPPMQGAPMQTVAMQRMAMPPMMPGMPAQPMGPGAQGVPGVAWMPTQGRFVPATYFATGQQQPVDVYAAQGMMNPAMMMPGYQQPAQPQVEPQQNAALLMQMLRESDYPSQREWAADQLAEQRWHSNPQVVNALLAAAKEDPAPMVRACCVRCLMKMQVQTLPVANVLQQLQEDTDPRVRDAVSEALTAMGIPPTKQPIQPVSTGTK